MGNNDEIMKAIEQVAASHEQSERRVAIEAFIHEVAGKLRMDVKGAFILATMGVPEPTQREIEVWCEHNRARFSLQVVSVVEILLRKELLGE